ncbi:MULTISPECIES: metal-dependent hydrolase family protein [Herbaspirillum]|uniref:metal-dependent hydrolase family protein n=1 Tax=Herbaspirillum TaxID=963 RepID=UPI0003F6A46B|nr:MULTISPECIES: amidohydrolase family protein [Herbaspirillum]AON56784.1 aryldialkylphosphatase-related protein [Herbaspirillum seropedicae]UIN21144.1 amidohydrolase family protein [Herbaspirillum frisingense]UWE16143.1 amidohydrolase family protein [Herbaspirillum huttiense]
MAKTLFKNVNIFDGTGTDPFIGDVLVENNRISQVKSGAGSIDVAGAEVIDGKGRFLMPGMTEGHTHFSWNDQPTLSAIQMMPPEEHILWCVRVAKRYLDMGWTSALGAAAAKPRLDVVLRNAINAGEFPGPRYLAGSQEITTIGALGDNTLPHLPYPELSFGSVCSGPEEIRRSARTFIKYGVDHLKINLSGEYIAGIPAEMSPFSEEEVAMLASEAKRFGKRVAVHARSAESVKQCVRHGLELIFHASFADEEALDMLEANKDKHFVVPGLGWLVRTSFHASEYGITPEIAKTMGYTRELEIASETLSKMHKRGIRILPGGDYGFAWMPHGTNANDLQYLVDYVGMTKKEALIAATKWGGEIMMRGNEQGQILPGYLADLVLVNENPLNNLAVLVDPKQIALVMIDGSIHKGLDSVSVPQAGIQMFEGDSPFFDYGVSMAIQSKPH